MKEYCENPLCGNRSIKEVPVSVRAASDQVRALCGTCEEVYTWGVQQGGMSTQKRPVWILALADRGLIAHVQIFVSESEAEKALAQLLRKYYCYEGEDDTHHVHAWLEDHAERFSMEIVESHIT